MKRKDPLNDLLRSVPLPDRPKEYWSDFPPAVIRATHQSQPTGRPLHQPRQRLLWTTVLAISCVLIGVYLAFNYGVQSFRKQDNWRGDLAMFQEIRELFPDRLQAIVIDGQQVKLLIADSPRDAQGPAFEIELRNAGRLYKVITFSGQRVQIQGRTIEILAGAGDHIFVVGSDFAWSSSNPESQPGGITITARSLAEKRS